MQDKKKYSDERPTQIKQFCLVTPAPDNYYLNCL